MARLAGVLTVVVAASRLHQVRDVHDGRHAGMRGPHNITHNQCGIVVKQSTARDAGTWTCKLFLQGNSQSTVKNVVRKEPKDGADYYWIGATDEHQDEVWRWVDGTQVAMGTPFWQPGEPNNYGGTEGCLAIWSTGYFNDNTCSNESYFICQDWSS